jgi:hypothetical protein
MEKNLHVVKKESGVVGSCQLCNDNDKKVNVITGETNIEIRICEGCSSSLKKKI